MNTNLLLKYVLPATAAAAVLFSPDYVHADGTEETTLKARKGKIVFSGSAGKGNGKKTGADSAGGATIETETPSPEVGSRPYQTAGQPPSGSGTIVIREETRAGPHRHKIPDVDNLEATLKRLEDSYNAMPSRDEIAIYTETARGFQKQVDAWNKKINEYKGTVQGLKNGIEEQKRLLAEQQALSRDNQAGLNDLTLKYGPGTPMNDFRTGVVERIWEPVRAQEREVQQAQRQYEATLRAAVNEATRTRTELNTVNQTSQQVRGTEGDERERVYGRLARASARLEVSSQRTQALLDQLQDSSQQWQSALELYGTGGREAREDIESKLRHILTSPIYFCAEGGALVGEGSSYGYGGARLELDQDYFRAFFRAGGILGKENRQSTTDNSRSTQRLNDRDVAETIREVVRTIERDPSLYLGLGLGTPRLGPFSVEVGADAQFGTKDTIVDGEERVRINDGPYETGSIGNRDSGYFASPGFTAGVRAEFFQGGKVFVKGNYRRDVGQNLNQADVGAGIRF